MLDVSRYLCEKYDKDHKFIPTDMAQRTTVLQWIHASEGQFMLHALAITYLRWFAPPSALSDGTVEETERGMSVNVQKDFDWLESELQNSKGQFLLGENLTAADIMMHFSAHFILARGLGTKGKSWPKVTEWLTACEAREGYKTAVEKSGYEL